MDEINFRWMKKDELIKLADMHREERIRVGYEIKDGVLISIDVDWNVPDWFVEGEGEHSINGMINFCSKHVDSGGRIIGAFNESCLVGVGVVTPEVRPGMAQLAFLHVSQKYRRRGIAVRLTEEMTNVARDTGAERMYVSATPSESAVGFYLSQGFVPTKAPLKELYELEPEDIHMVKDLRAPDDEFHDNA